MNNTRKQMRDEAFEDYDFGPELSVTDHHGWENDGKDTYIKVLYLEDERAPGANMKVSFHVDFYPGQDKVKDVSAYLTENGGEIGYSPMLASRMNLRFK